MRRLPYPIPLCGEAFLGTAPVMPAWLFQAFAVCRRLAFGEGAVAPVKPGAAARDCSPVSSNAGGLRRHDRMPAPLA